MEENEMKNEEKTLIKNLERLISCLINFQKRIMNSYLMLKLNQYMKNIHSLKMVYVHL